jgi:hypothetical protein
MNHSFSSSDSLRHQLLNTCSLFNTRDESNRTIRTSLLPKPILPFIVEHVHPMLTVDIIKKADCTSHAWTPIATTVLDELNSLLWTTKNSMDEFFKSRVSECESAEYKSLMADLTNGESEFHKELRVMNCFDLSLAVPVTVDCATTEMFTLCRVLHRNVICFTWIHQPLAVVSTNKDSSAAYGWLPPSDRAYCPGYCSVKDEFGASSPTLAFFRLGLKCPCVYHADRTDRYQFDTLQALQIPFCYRATQTLLWTNPTECEADIHTIAAVANRRRPVMDMSVECHTFTEWIVTHFGELFQRRRRCYLLNMHRSVTGTTSACDALSALLHSEHRLTAHRQRWTAMLQAVVDDINTANQCSIVISPCLLLLITDDPSLPMLDLEASTAMLRTLLNAKVASMTAAEKESVTLLSRVDDKPGYVQLGTHAIGVGAFLFPKQVGASVVTQAYMRDVVAEIHYSGIPLETMLVTSSKKRKRSDDDDDDDDDEAEAGVGSAWSPNRLIFDGPQLQMTNVKTPLGNSVSGIVIHGVGSYIYICKTNVATYFTSPRCSRETQKWYKKCMNLHTRLVKQQAKMPAGTAPLLIQRHNLASGMWAQVKRRMMPDEGTHTHTVSFIEASIFYKHMVPKSKPKPESS